MISKIKGFTLIELLVVIAIIGILAAVVLVSLNQARDQANNATIRAEMSQMRAEAELLYSQVPGSYEGVCTNQPSGANPRRFYDSADETSDGADNVCNVATDSSEWAAAVKLIDSENFFCVDSTGAARETDALSTATVCPAAI